MPNSEKISAVAELTEHFSTSSAAVVTEYRGLTVKQITDLRRALGRDTTYAVVKNTLTRRAAADAGVTLDDSLLTGPTAIAFVKGDAVEAAKGLRDFARTNPLLVVKGGVLDGKALSASEISQIADLESREVLLARVAGGLKALPTRAAGLFQAPLAQIARLAEALKEKKEPGDAALPADSTDTADTTGPAEATDSADTTGTAEATDTAAATDTAEATDTADTAPDTVGSSATEEAPAEPAE